MILFFGLEMDEGVFPKTWSDPNHPYAGCYYCGPKNLLKLLEKQLTLNGLISENNFLRVEQYRQVLKQHLVREPDAFYGQSFEADQMGTAVTLLKWRDELIVGGVDFKNKAENLPQRLNTLFGVERLLDISEQLLYPGYADRFVRVVEVLQNEVIPITKIILNEPLDLLPYSFQRLFEIMKNQGVPLEVNTIQANAEKEDLKSFQYFLGNRYKGVAQKKLQGDGSLILIKGKRETDLAVWLARLLRLNPDLQPVCLIPEKNRALDDALIHDGFPSLGILSESLARPTLQILKLVNAFLWKPVDPFKIMEFVSLSVKPLWDELAEIIAEQMAKTPGIKSERWNQVVFNYFKGLEKRAETDTTIEVEAIRKEYEFWFERKRYDINEMVPKDDVVAVFNYIHLWALKQHQENSYRQNSILVLSDQARKIRDLLLALPENESQLSNLQVERIVRTVYEPTPVMFREPQAGHLPYVYHPAAITKPVPDVFWWNFVDREPDHTFSHWYEEEWDYFRKNDLPIEPIHRQNARALWLRHQPVFRATDRLVFIVPEVIEGREMLSHPLLGDLSGAFENIENITFDIDAANPNEILSDWALPEKEALVPRLLGDPKPYIHMPENKLFETPDTESFSSLESLFYYPYKWVFKHKIKLRASSILSVVREHTLMGNLAHRVFELMFEEDTSQWTKADTEQWITERLPKLLEEEGAILLLYGKEPERINFENLLKYSAWSLIHTIQSNQWKVVATEQQVRGDFMDLKVKGFIDLVLERDGEIAIVDLKWSGAGYRENTFRNREDLQLVIYSKLIKNAKPWAHTAYFIISQAKMIARNHLAFNNATAVDPEVDHLEVHQSIWEKMEATYTWRSKQLDEGKIEVRTEETLEELNEEIVQITDLSNLLEMKNEGARYDDYKTLINLVK